jgi:HEPN domain-containing protein
MMNDDTEKAKNNWLDSAQYDYDTAANMLEARRYIYAVFMCHLCLEKALKAACQDRTGEMPPRTHDLESLMELAGLMPDEDMDGFISELSNISVITRYPTDFNRTLREFSRQRAEDIFKGTTEVFDWIKRQLKR